MSRGAHYNDNHQMLNKLDHKRVVTLALDVLPVQLDSQQLQTKHYSHRSGLVALFRYVKFSSSSKPVHLPFDSWFTLETVWLITKLSSGCNAEGIINNSIIPIININAITYYAFFFFFLLSQIYICTAIIKLSNLKPFLSYKTEYSFRSGRSIWQIILLDTVIFSHLKLIW